MGPGAAPFSYDSLDRLRRYERGVLAEGGGSIATPISLPGTDQSRTYDLDGLGNWRRTAFQPVGGAATTEVRQHNGLNQITRRDGTPFSYDANGNLLDDGVRLYTWDAFNRLLEVRRKSDGLTIGQYVYDAGGRRVLKTVSNGGLSGTIPNGVTRFLYNPDWQCVEERDGSGGLRKQFVWGVYIDELLQQWNYVTINGHGAGDYYPLSDLLWRTVALTDWNAQIVETYDCDAYGNTLIFGSPGTGGNWWADDAVRDNLPICRTVFTGREFDAESEEYCYRNRYYDSSLCTFISRDPAKSDVNLYRYCASRRVLHVDPSGRWNPGRFQSPNHPLFRF